jgi:hypothetical protein
VNRRRQALLGTALGLTASQAGHLVAYALRFGPAAAHLQSSGAHAYFPALVKTGLGLTALFVLLALLAIGLARVIAGRPVPNGPAPSFLRFVAILFCFQLGCYVVQETIELAAGAPATSVASLLLWGTLGQLPVALLSALVLRWLAVRLGPAVASLLAAATPALRLAPQTLALVVNLSPAPVPVSDERLSHWFRRRGPPL